jgi:hypothetical protein
MTDYRQNASPAEKLSTLLNDKRVKEASTFSQFANSDANQDAGRFAQINKSTVVGATPVPEYPRLPENSWTNDPTGVEPPLGFVDETPIVGEVGEVQASIDRLANAAPATQSVHVPDAVAVERREDPTPTRTGSDLTAPSVLPVGSSSPETKPVPVAGIDAGTRRKPK